LPFRVHVVQTDNGAEFQSEFHRHLERLGHPACVHSPAHPAPQRQGRAVTSRRRPGVLPAP
jgi:hypothetical protein